MTSEELKNLVKSILELATDLKNTHTEEINAPVNYACIFAQSENEYVELDVCASRLGRVAKETISGQLYIIDPIDTVAGPLRLLKIRKLDSARPERGDADFTVTDYQSFKRRVLSRDHFSLIDRGEFEMIELHDGVADVRVYFSNPTVANLLGIK